MKSSKSLLTAGILVVAVFGMAQRAKSPHYDPGKEITVRGTIEDVIPAQHVAATAIHLKVKSPDNIFDVRVGPAWFVQQKRFTFSAGDQIEVTGALMPIKGGEALVARTVTKGTAVLVLRDANGFPLWSGGKRAPKG